MASSVWRHERKARRLEVRIEPFVKLPSWARRAAEDEAERLAGFSGGELDLRWDADLERTSARGRGTREAT